MAKIEEAAAVYSSEAYELPKLTETEAHRIAMRTPMAKVVTELEAVLSRPLAAYSVGVKDPKTLARWASDPSPKIRQLDVERRLRAAFQVITMLRPWDDDETIRAVWIGMSPALNDGTIADAIREDRLRDALDAAHDFIAHG